jgi:beta-glucanase (GH16 family)
VKRPFDDINGNQKQCSAREEKMDRHHSRTGNVSRGLRVFAGVLSFFVFFTIWPANAQDPLPPASIPLPANATAWKLIFNDNFDGTAYDTSRWNPYADWGGNGSFNSGRENYYPSQIRVSNGICNLVAEPNPGITTFTNSYKSGELISARTNTNAATPYKFSFLYGYIEARLKIVNISGFFGAFWMIPAKKNYNYEWEIDILEVLGHDHRTMFQTYHYFPGLPLDQARNTSWTPNKGSGNNGGAPVLDYSTGYHTYGVDWQPDHLTFYIDGIASGKFPSPGTNNSNIANTPGYILIQQMVENSWIRATGQLLPDSAASRDTFHIDYVHVWQGTSGNGTNPVRPLLGRKPVVEVSPNPAHGQVRFAVKSLDQNPVSAVMIFDEQGRLVRRLSAQHTLWDGINQAGVPVKSGMYLYRVLVRGNEIRGKVFLVR